MAKAKTTTKTKSQEEPKEKGLYTIIIPVNNTVLVNCIEKKEYLELRGKPTGDEPEKVSEHIYAPAGYTDNTDPDTYVQYDYGIVELINEEMKLPYDLRVGDIVVYNHGAVVDYQPAQKIKKKVVDLSQIIVVYRKEETK